MQTAIAIYLAVGFLLGFGLLGLGAVTSLRRRGFHNAVRGAARTYLDELPLYWRVPVAAWTFLIAAPLIALWAILRGEWDPVGAASVALLWLLYFALLRWHLRAKARARKPASPPRRHARAG